MADGLAELAASLELTVARAVTPVDPGPTVWPVDEPWRADEDGIVGEGADLEPSTLVAAYRAGVFPWPHDDWLPWFSPDPRAVIPIGGLHVSHRLARTIRQRRFRVTIDAAFEDVMLRCSEERSDGVWITDAMVAAYCRLHELGWAHSVETWEGERLVGGLYGVSIGGFFAAESMFYRVSDASKVALAGFMAQCEREGIELVDIQVLTDHTRSMGGVEIAKGEYLERLARAVTKDVRFAGAGAR
ncbi:MAG TPA: leucyl/phenylalanyl-tRNA--protein transferase [Tepidiformaceae bacterium]|nr:leucyl/phenylalanyl-tRNA--protein transferase [Tepidiformaceae bacterium]